MRWQKALFLAVGLWGLPLFAEGFRVDEATYLMWQDVPENRGMTLNWEEAKAYCGALELEGFGDWWLPSESELISIVDLERPEGRRIQKGFRYVRGAAYWSSSTYAWNAPHAWLVSFASGTALTDEKAKRHFVRCVRCSDFNECIERFYKK